MTIGDFASYRNGLRAAHVVIDRAERMAMITDAADALATAEGLTLRADPGLLEEVAGLVEWPHPLIGRFDDDFMDVIDANLNGGFRVAKRVSKGMMKGRWGRMIFISSIVGLGGRAVQANYAASKAGLIGMAKSFAKEFASRGITANVVCPGPIETDMLAALTDAQRDAMLGVVPVGRLGQGDEIAAAVEFLASDSAAYITGTVLPVDGGYSMG